jgi:hypothetical protein
MTMRFVHLVRLILFLSLGAWAQSSGTVTGVVVDDRGKPVTQAEVHIAEKKPFVGHRLVEMHDTDDQGRFMIKDVPFGTYVVMAGKEEAGYPDSRLAFYSNLSVPTITLSPPSPTGSVTVALGPKAGVLEVSTADAANGKKIESASVTLRRVANPNFFITTSASKQRIPVPSKVDISLEVSAPGYETYYYPDPANPARSTPIHLKPGEELKLDIRLHPAVSQTKQ